MSVYDARARLRERVKAAQGRTLAPLYGESEPVSVELFPLKEPRQRRRNYRQGFTPPPEPTPALEPVIAAPHVEARPLPEPDPEPPAPPLPPPIEQPTVWSEPVIDPLARRLSEVLRDERLPAEARQGIRMIVSCALRLARTGTE